MSWRDRLQPASFRGVAFFVKSDEAEFGRRQVTHTAALVDTPSLEDLGRAADVFQVEGYLVGDDYDLQRDNLIKAIRDTPGEGRLVHPSYGDRSVGASGFRIRTDTAEGRVCRFTVTFSEAGELGQPRITIDSPNVLAARADAIQEASRESFLERFGVDGFPQFVRESVIGQLDQLSDFLASPGDFSSTLFSDGTSVFGAVGEFLTGDSELIPAFQQSVARFSRNIGSLVSSPGELAGSLTSLISGIRRSFGSSSSSILGSLYNLFPSSPPRRTSGLTPSRDQVISNTESLAQLVNQTVLAELAVVVVSKEYDTFDDAIDSRDKLADLIDQQAEITPSDEVYTQLTQARAEVIQGLPRPDQDTSRLVPYTPPSTKPALVIAQALYDDAQRDSDIVRRNSVRHPGFVAGSKPLQVVTNG